MNGVRCFRNADEVLCYMVECIIATLERSRDIKRTSKSEIARLEAIIQTGVENCRALKLHDVAFNVGALRVYKLLCRPEVGTMSTRVKPTVASASIRQSPLYTEHFFTIRSAFGAGTESRTTESLERAFGGALPHGSWTIGPFDNFGITITIGLETRKVSWEK